MADDDVTDQPTGSAEDAAPITGAGTTESSDSADGTDSSGTTESSATAPRRPAPGRPRPTPGARAATRARRIGGRPMPGPAVDDDEPTESLQPDTAAATATGADASSTARSRAGTRGARSAAALRARESAAELRAAAADPVLTTQTVKPDKSRKSTKVSKRRRAKSATTDGVQLPGWVRWLPAGVTIAATIALAAIVAVLSHSVWWAKPNVYSQRDAILSAAKTCSARIFSYDYRKIPANKKAAASCIYGKFATQYQDSLTKIIAPNAPQQRSVQSTTVQQAGIVSSDPKGKQWTVLILGQSLIVNSATSKTGRTDQLQLTVTMEKHGGNWVIVGARLPTTPTS
jgi:hypothetical protein